MFLEELEATTDPERGSEETEVLPERSEETEPLDFGDLVVAPEIAPEVVNLAGILAELFVVQKYC